MHWLFKLIKLSTCEGLVYIDKCNTKNSRNLNLRMHFKGSSKRVTFYVHGCMCYVITLEGSGTAVSDVSIL